VLARSADGSETEQTVRVPGKLTDVVLSANGRKSGRAGARSAK
jgi:hypothetical protein